MKNSIAHFQIFFAGQIYEAKGTILYRYLKSLLILEKFKIENYSFIHFFPLLTQLKHIWGRVPRPLIFNVPIKVTNF